MKKETKMLSVKKQLKWFFFILAILFLIPEKTKAQTIHRYQIDLITDNDLYTNALEDRYYSNGLFVNFRWSEKTEGTSLFLKKIWSVGIGHQIYVPYQSKIDSLSQIDRPFSAYLYANASLRLFKKNEMVHHITVQLGTIGPRAKGEELQRGYHKMIGIFVPQGWQYQLKNEFGVNIVYDYLKLLYYSKNRTVDLGLPVRIKLGNTFSGVSIGTVFRIGQLKPYHASAYTGGNLAYSEPDKNCCEYYFFIKPQFNYVAYDATIQGKMFGERDIHAMGKKNFVYETTLGAAFSSGRWGIYLSAHLKTREAKKQSSPHSYGRIGIEFRF